MLNLSLLYFLCVVGGVAAVVVRCSCSMCSKKGFLHLIASPAQFRLVCGREMLSLCQTSAQHTHTVAQTISRCVLLAANNEIAAQQMRDEVNEENNKSQLFFALAALAMAIVLQTRSTRTQRSICSVACAASLHSIVRGHTLTVTV